MEMRRNVMAIRAVAERADERAGKLAATVERLSELNEKLWSHHLEFCGQVTAELANAEREVLDELDALRRTVIDVRSDHQDSRSAGPTL